MTHTVTAVDGLDRVDINNKLHDLNEEISKLQTQMIGLREVQSMYVEMRDMIDLECERRERSEEVENLFDEMFGGWLTLTHSSLTNIMLFDLPVYKKQLPQVWLEDGKFVIESDSFRYVIEDDLKLLFKLCRRFKTDAIQQTYVTN